MSTSQAMLGCPREVNKHDSWCLIPDWCLHATIVIIYAYFIYCHLCVFHYCFVYYLVSLCYPEACCQVMVIVWYMVYY